MLNSIKLFLYKTFVVEPILWFICWMMAINSCLQVNTLDLGVIKSAHNITVHYKTSFWAYMNGDMTKEEHDKIEEMYWDLSKSFTEKGSTER